MGRCNPITRKDLMQNNHKPERIGKILTRIMARRGFQRQIFQEQIENIWAETVGEILVGQTRPGNIRCGVLEVFVAHSIFEQELSLLQPEILQKLNAAMGEKKIKRFKFTLMQ